MWFPEFTREYLARIRTAPETYAEDARRMLEQTVETRRLYHGVTIPMTYQGVFFTSEDVRHFETIIETMVRIGRKVTEAYVRDPEYRKGFHFDALTERLILADPGYEEPVPVGRYDIFYEGGEAFQFCELNTDGSSAMNEDRVLGQILQNTRIFREMESAWRIQPFELFDSLAAAFLARYEAIRGGKPQCVAIVDAMEKGTTIEFQVFREAFARAGVLAMVADVRAMRYEHGRLMGVDVETGEEHAVDLVYRRLVTSDFVELRRRGEAQAFEDAYRDQAFLCFGSFRSQVMHAKTLFSVLHHEHTRRILSEEENAFVAAHVPWTKELATEADREKVRTEKDRFILKPYNSYASQGVLLGREHDQEEWNRIVAALPLDQLIYQRYVDSTPTPFVELDAAQQRLVETRMGHVIGLFLYDEHFAGIYTRVGHGGIISGAREYYAAPAFVAERR